MRTDNVANSGSDLRASIETLQHHIEQLKNAPLHKRAGIAVLASECSVLILRDLDRRILQLECVECDQQNDRHGDLPAV